MLFAFELVGTSYMQFQVSSIGPSYVPYSTKFDEYGVSGSVVHAHPLEKLSELLSDMGVFPVHRIVIEAHIQVWKTFAAATSVSKDTLLHTKNADDVAKQVRRASVSVPHSQVTVHADNSSWMNEHHRCS